MERQTPLAAEFGPEGKLWGVNKKQRSCDGGGGARSAPLGVFESPKRGVRAAHGPAREAKTH